MELMRRPAVQRDVWQSQLRFSQLLAQKGQCCLGYICRVKAFALWSDPEQQQSRPAPDLPNPLRAQGQYPLHCTLNPDPHFFRGNGLTRITADPPGDVERRILRAAAWAVGLIEGHRPVRNLLSTQTVCRLLRASIVMVGNDIRDQPLVSGFIFADTNHA